MIPRARFGTCSRRTGSFTSIFLPLSWEAMVILTNQARQPGASKIDQGMNPLPVRGSMSFWWSCGPPCGPGPRGESRGQQVRGRLASLASADRRGDHPRGRRGAYFAYVCTTRPRESAGVPGLGDTGRDERATISHIRPNAYGGQNSANSSVREDA